MKFNLFFQKFLCYKLTVSRYFILKCVVYMIPTNGPNILGIVLNPDSHSPQPQPPFSMIIPSTRKHYKPNQPERRQFDSIKKMNVRLTRFRKIKAVSSTVYRNAVPLRTLQSPSGDSLSSYTCSTSPAYPFVLRPLVSILKPQPVRSIKTLSTSLPEKNRLKNDGHPKFRTHTPYPALSDTFSGPETHL